MKNLLLFLIGSTICNNSFTNEYTSYATIIPEFHIHDEKIDSENVHYTSNLKFGFQNTCIPNTNYNYNTNQTHPHFNTLSKEQFAEFVETQGIRSTKELVQTIEWWNYKAFWDYVESLPDGHEKLLKYGQEFLKKYKSTAACIWASLQGEYAPGQYALVKKRLAEHIKRQSASQINKHKTKIQKEIANQKNTQENIIQQNVETHLARYESNIISQIERWYEDSSDRLQHRAQIFQETVHSPVYNDQQYQLHESHYLFFDYSITDIQHLYGNQIQHCLHEELLACIERMLPIQQYKNNVLLRETVDLTLIANRSGYIIHAMRLVDLCYAVVNGIADSLLNTADRLLHPIDTLKHTVQSTFTIVQCVTQMMQTPIKLMYWYATDTETFYIRCNDITESIEYMCKTVYNHGKKQTLPTLVRSATKIITELLLMHYIVALSGKLCTEVGKHVTQFIQTTHEQFVVTNVPGLKVTQARAFLYEQSEPSHGLKARMGQAVTDSTPVALIESSAVKTIKEFFEQRKFGKLLRQYCEKTKFRYQDQPIYRVIKKIEHEFIEEGDFFYLDAAHKNHLEVFRGSGGCVKKIRAVINLNGTYNESKSITAISQQRILKW